MSHLVVSPLVLQLFLLPHPLVLLLSRTYNSIPLCLTLWTTFPISPVCLSRGVCAPEGRVGEEEADRQGGRGLACWNPLLHPLQGVIRPPGQPQARRECQSSAFHRGYEENM